MWPLSAKIIRDFHEQMEGSMVSNRTTFKLELTKTDDCIYKTPMYSYNTSYKSDNRVFEHHCCSFGFALSPHKNLLPIWLMYRRAYETRAIQR